PATKPVGVWLARNSVGSVDVVTSSPSHIGQAHLNLRLRLKLHAEGSTGLDAPTGEWGLMD
ncbi:hypothetical protein C4E44_13950, partial [Pseudomonas sp. MWU12-2312b]